MASVVLAVSLAAAPASETFIGTVTDDMCPRANHAAMRMGPTDRECAIACADAHGAAYVLFDGEHTYQLSDQQTAASFAGQRVRVKGSLDAQKKTIQIESIEAVK